MIEQLFLRKEKALKNAATSSIMFVKNNLLYMLEGKQR